MRHRHAAAHRRWLASRIGCHNHFLQAHYDEAVAQLHPGQARHLPPQLRQ